MNLSIYKEDLISLLNKTQNIVEKRTQMPVLANVLLEATESELIISATNLEVSLTDRVAAEIHEEGKTTVNAKNLLDLVRELNDGLIHLVKKENDWLTITQEKSEFNVVGISHDQFPVFPSYNSIEYIKFDSKVLLEMIEKTIYSTSNDDARYHLTGVYFEAEEQESLFSYKMVSTDGHRLSLIKKKINEDELNKVSKKILEGVIIPRKGLFEMRKILDSLEEPVLISIEGSQLFFKHKNCYLMIRLIEGKYPNYKVLIPKELKEKININKEKFFQSVKRVSLLSSHKSKGITLSFENNKLNIASNNPDLGDGKEELEVSYDGKPLKISYNSRFLLEVLSNIQEDYIQLEFKDHLSPTLIKPVISEEYLCVVMPLSH